MNEEQAELLRQAINNVAHARFMKELREAAVYGPAILGEIYTELMRLQQEKNDEKAQ